MSVYYKFKSAKDFNSVAIDGHFISVGHLKEKIFVKKQLGRGTDFDLVVTNAQTNEEYLDEGMLIPKNTSVVIRRVPGPPRNPIKTAPVSEQEEPNVETNCVGVGAVFGSFAGVDPTAEEFKWDEFGEDVYAIPESVPAHSSILVQDTRASKEEEDEESKIKALIETSALDWQHQPCEGNGPGRGFGRGIGRGGFEKKTPPQGYTCHRCNVAGHFIQHCPTNGDPNFDVKRVKPPTGIPKSMLMATTDGSFALPSGVVAVWKPNEAAFEKQFEGMSSTRPVPAELHCPLCKQVIKDAVLTSKCCFASFCDTCIRDVFISKAKCVCGATKVLADDLLPNKTLRDTINRILEGSNAPAAGSALLESRNPQANVPTPTQSAASKGQDVPVTANKIEDSNLPLPQEKGTSIQVSEDTAGASRRTNKEVQQKPKKKLRQEFPPENYMPPFAHFAFNPYWNGMPPCGGPMPYMGYGVNPMYDPFGGPGCMMPYGPPLPQAELGMGRLAGPPVTSRDEIEAPEADLKRKREMERRDAGPPNTSRDKVEAPKADLKRKRDMERCDAGPPTTSRDEFGAPKADLKRRRETERREDRRDGEYGRERSTRGYDSSRSKYKSTPPSVDRHRHRSPPERRSRDVVLPRPSSNKKSEHRIDRFSRFSNNRRVIV